MQSLEPQVSRSRRYGNPLSVIAMEIDSYKTADNVEQPVTDQVLTAVSFYLRDQMRWVDLVGRTQDNEFTLILPETTENDAVKLAHKIKARIQSLSLPDSPETTISVHAKFGISSWGKGDDTTMLLRKCKESMSDVIPEEESALS
jgi:diguanylate cyclase (GGDEF)-like protein